MKYRSDLGGHIFPLAFTTLQTVVLQSCRLSGMTFGQDFNANGFYLTIGFKKTHLTSFLGYKETGKTLIFYDILLSGILLTNIA